MSDRVNFVLFSRCVSDGMSDVDIGRYLGLSKAYVCTLRHRWKMPKASLVRQKRIARAIEQGGFKHWQAPAKPFELDVAERSKPSSEAQPREPHVIRRKPDMAKPATLRRAKATPSMADHPAIRALMLQGVTDQEIARRVQQRRNAIHDLRMQWGLPSAASIKVQRIAERMEAYGQAWGAQTRVADELGISVGTVNQICHRLGLTPQSITPTKEAA